MLTLISVVIVFGVLIAIHEFGHFLVAKRSGVQVDEYAIGFGPALYSTVRGETRYSLRVFPLGGYCKMAGMVRGESEEDEAVPPERAFYQKPVTARMAIIAAGPAMNFLLAFVLFAFTFSVLGLPTEPTLVVDGLQTGYPAQEAGLRAGDEILAVEGQKVSNWDELVEHIRSNPGVPLRLTVDREGATVEFTVIPRREAGGNGVVGINPKMAYRKFGPIESITQGVTWTWAVISGWFIAIGQIIFGEAGVGADVMGPVGIIAQIGQAAEMGMAYLLLLAAILSANLGLVNLLPIPALDGSRIVFLLVEAIRGRPLAPERENFIHFVGFALLILLSLVITYRDVLRLSLG